MRLPILNLVPIVALSCGLAVVAIIGNALRTDSDPAVDGPRALLAEFFGLWIGFACLASSFVVRGQTLQWSLRAIAASAAAIGLLLAAYFAGTPEVLQKPDKEPTGFENDEFISLQLRNREGS